VQSQPTEVTTCLHGLILGCGVQGGSLACMALFLSSHRSLCDDFGDGCQFGVGCCCAGEGGDALGGSCRVEWCTVHSAHRGGAGSAEMCSCISVCGDHHAALGASAEVLAPFASVALLRLCPASRWCFPMGMSCSARRPVSGTVSLSVSIRLRSPVSGSRALGGV